MTLTGSTAQIAAATRIRGEFIAWAEQVKEDRTGVARDHVDEVVAKVMSIERAGDLLDNAWRLTDSGWDQVIAKVLGNDRFREQVAAERAERRAAKRA